MSYIESVDPYCCSFLPSLCLNNLLSFSHINPSKMSQESDPAYDPSHAKEDASTHSGPEQGMPTGSQGASRQASGSRASRKPRGETRWPSDTLIVREADDEGVPLDPLVHTRLKRVCGLTGR